MNLENQDIETTLSQIFSEKDRAKIQKAADSSNMNYNAIITTGALQYADSLLNKVDKPVKGDLKINDLVNKTIAHNENVKELQDKIEITQGFIESTTGCNRANIKRYLSANSERIAHHHKKSASFNTITTSRANTTASTVSI